MSHEEMVRVRIDLDRYAAGLLMLQTRRHATLEEAENNLAMMGVLREADGTWVAPRRQLWRLAGQYEEITE